MAECYFAHFNLNTGTLYQLSTIESAVCTLLMGLIDEMHTAALRNQIPPWCDMGNQRKNLQSKFIRRVETTWTLTVEARSHLNTTRESRKLKAGSCGGSCNCGSGGCCAECCRRCKLNQMSFTNALPTYLCFLISGIMTSAAACCCIFLVTMLGTYMYGQGLTLKFWQSTLAEPR